MPVIYFFSDTKYTKVSLAFLGSELPFFGNSFSSHYLCFVGLMWHTLSVTANLSQSRGRAPDLDFNIQISRTNRTLGVSSLVCNWASVIPGGVLPEKLGRGVRPSSENAYPIYDQNLRFSLPYL